MSISAATPTSPVHENNVASLSYEEVFGNECKARPFNEICAKVRRICYDKELKLFYVMIAAYNEPIEEFLITLYSVLKSFHHLYVRTILENDDFGREVLGSLPMICPVFDGTEKMHSTMKQWLNRYFPTLLDGMDGQSQTGTVDVKSDLKCFEFVNLEADGGNYLTPTALASFAPRTATDDISSVTGATTISASSVIRACREDQTALKFLMKPIVKRQNHRKHNSHSWCFAQCQELDDRVGVLLLTDCGTKYHYNSISLLWKALVENQNLVGVTGRLRVEEPNDAYRPCEQCGAPFPHTNFLCSACPCCWLTYYLTPCAIQAYECEATFAIFTAVYNLVEAIAVLPGPGQCFRWKYLKDVVANYDRLLTSHVREPELGFMIRSTINPTTAGVERAPDTGEISWYEFILTQAQLAEDRILSFVANFSTGRNTKYIQGATFLYQPMITWQSYLIQRRRWINGAFGALLFSIDSRRFVAAGTMRRENNFFTNRANILFLWCTQVVQLLFVLIAPAIFSAAIYLASNDVADRLHIHDDNKLHFKLGEILTVAFLAVYSAWVMYSYYVAKVPEMICVFVVLISCFYSLIIYSSIFLGIRERGIEFYSCIFIIALASPAGNALFFSSRSVLKLIYFAPSYLLCIMFPVVFVPAYSFARLHDTTWGNRETAGDASVTNERVETIKTRVLRFNLVLVFSNCAIAYGLFSIPKNNEDAYIVVTSLVSALFFLQILYCIIHQILRVTQWIWKACCGTPREMNGSLYERSHQSLSRLERAHHGRSRHRQKSNDTLMTNLIGDEENGIDDSIYRTETETNQSRNSGGNSLNHETQRVPGFIENQMEVPRQNRRKIGSSWTA